MSEDVRDAIIVRADIGAGHDGNAELLVKLRYENGVERTVVLDAKVGLALLRACGAEDLEDLAGKSWRKILEEL